jgi:hypothetical protein
MSTLSSPSRSSARSAIVGPADALTGGPERHTAGVPPFHTFKGAASRPWRLVADAVETNRSVPDPQTRATRCPWNGWSKDVNAAGASAL